MSYGEKVIRKRTIEDTHIYIHTPTDIKCRYCIWRRIKLVFITSSRIPGMPARIRLGDGELAASDKIVGSAYCER